MRVLVTGGAGFLGQHVSRYLQNEQVEVSVFDLAEVRGVRSIIGNLEDLDAVIRAANGNDIIIHLGGIGDAKTATENPALAVKANVVGSVNVSLAARSVGARIIYASTWEVYGAPLYEPIDEDHPCRPNNPYNVSKLSGEQMLLAIDRLQGVPVLALRLGSAYGHGLRPGSVIRAFISAARRGEPVIIHGDGYQRRQFTHVSDIARAIFASCLSRLHGVALNVVTSEVLSVREIARLVVDRHPAKIVFGQARNWDVPSGIVSSERARQLLGWEALVKFKEGLFDILGENSEQSIEASSPSPDDHYLKTRSENLM